MSQLALFTALALGVAAAQGKHLGGRLTMETPPTAVTTGETAVSTETRNSSAFSAGPDFVTSLRTPLAVYTVPLSARVALTPLGMRSPGRVNQSSAMELFDIQTEYKQLGYIKYADAPAMVLKYFLAKATWTEAQSACAADGAALYTFDHSVQLDSAMANFYPLLLPWVDLQKSGVDGGSMVCAFLNGPASGKSSLQWDFCHAMHDFICQKPASNLTEIDATNVRIPTHINARVKLVTLSDFLSAFVAQSQTAVSLFKPIINEAAVQSPLLARSQVSEIDSLMTQWQDFNFMTMPDIITMVTNTPTMSVAQIQQIQQATAKGVSLFAETQTLINLHSAQLNLSAAELPVVGFTRQAVSFYTVMASVVSNALSQPIVSPAQALALEDIVTQTQTLIDGAEIAFRAMTTKAVPTLDQLLQTVLAQGQESFSLLQPIIAAASTSTLTLAESIQLQTLIAQTQAFNYVLMPSIVAMVALYPTLTPVQILLLVDAVTQGVTVYTNVQSLTATIAPKLNLTPVLQQAVTDITSQGISLFSILLGIVNVPFGQPTVSAAQLTQIQDAIAQTQSVINAATNSLTTTTTTTTTAAPLSPVAQLLEDVLAPGQAAFSLLQPIISAASTLTLTPTEAVQLQALISQSQSYNFVLMPSLITIVATNPTLTPMQLTSLQDAVARGIILYSAAQSLTVNLALKLNINAAQQQVIIDVTNQGIALYGSLLEVVNDPSGQPSFSVAQLLQIQTVIAQTQNVINTAANTFTTTTPSSTTVAPVPTLAQLLQAAMAPYQSTFSLLGPLINEAAANSPTLTPTEAAALQSAISQVQNYIDVLLPGIISMVEGNPTLSPTQLQQLADAVAQGATLSTHVQWVVGTILPKLNLGPVIQNTLGDLAGQGTNLFGALLAAVNDPSGQPLISPAQLLDIQNKIEQAQSTAIAGANYLASTTSSPTPTTTMTSTSTTRPTTRPTRRPTTRPMTRPPTTTRGTMRPTTQYQGSIDTSLQLVLARIRGVIAELEALLHLLRSLPSTDGIRANAAQRRQAEDIVTQLLSLRTRQTEIEERVGSMAAHEQEAIAGKLETVQRRLRKVVSDRSLFAQYLTVTSEKQQPIVELLNETADVLKPFL